MKKEITPPPAPQRRPAQWDKIVAYAYLRMQGKTQEQGAKGVGRSRRTVQLWEADRDAWRQAREQARERWMADTEDAARRAVQESISLGNAALAWDFLQRIDTALAPPKQRVDVAAFDPTKLSDEQLERIAAGESVTQVVRDGRGSSSQR